MKWCRFLICIILMSFCMVSCGKESEKEMKLANQFVVNNSESVSDIIKTEYELASLQSFFREPFMNETVALQSTEKNLPLSVHDVDSCFPIECLRFNQNMFYTVYKVKEGGFFYVFWIESVSDDSLSGCSEPIVYYAAYLSSIRPMSDFVMLRKGIDTAQDVHDIDPSSELLFLTSNGIYSYSIVDNGLLMEFEYVRTDSLKSKSDLIIKDMNVCDRGSTGSCLSAIFLTDLP